MRPHPLVVRALEGIEDGQRLQALFEHCADWFERTFGHPPFPSEAQSAFLAGLDKVAPSDKYLVGALTPSAASAPPGSGHTEPALVGVLDGIRGYPDAAWWTIGLVLVAPSARRRRVGTQLIEAFEAESRRFDARGVRAQAAPPGDAACIAFLEEQGFTREGPAAGSTTPTDIFVKELRL